MLIILITSLLEQVNECKSEILKTFYLIYSCMPIPTDIITNNDTIILNNLTCDTPAKGETAMLINNYGDNEQLR